MIFHSNIEELDHNTLARVNDFIHRSFLRRADKNYIAARQLFLSNLDEDFFTAAQQCLEKYLKSILLLNGKTIENKHNLLGIFRSVKNLPIWDKNHDLNFPVYLLSKLFHIEESLDQFLDRITMEGMNRYGSVGSITHGDELYKLDWAVHLFRRYCRSPNVEINQIDREKTLEERKEIWWRLIRDSKAKINSFLEDVLEKEEYKNLKHVLLQGNCFLRGNLPGEGSEELFTLQNEVNWRIKAESSAIQNIYQLAESEIGGKRSRENMISFLKVISYLRKKVYFTDQEHKGLQEVVEIYLNDLLLDRKE